MQELYVGSGFALSRLSLAEELKDDFDQYILHPCIIDGALQTVIGIARGAESDTPYLPFALGEVEILRPLTQTCYAYVEHAASDSTSSDVKQFNIRLLSESGDVLVKLNNFRRALRGSVQAQREHVGFQAWWGLQQGPARRLPQAPGRPSFRLRMCPA
jgi:hypothetical protein